MESSKPTWRGRKGERCVRIQVLFGILVVLKWIEVVTWQIDTAYASNVTLFCAFAFSWFGIILIWESIEAGWVGLPFKTSTSPPNGVIRIEWGRVVWTLLTLAALFGTLLTVVPRDYNSYYAACFIVAGIGALLPCSLAMLRIVQGAARPFWFFFVVLLVSFGGFILDFRYEGHFEAQFWLLGVAAGIVLAVMARARLVPRTSGVQIRAALPGIRPWALVGGLFVACLVFGFLARVFFHQNPEQQSVFWMLSALCSLFPVLVLLWRMFNVELRFVVGILMYVLLGMTVLTADQLAQDLRAWAAGLVGIIGGMAVSKLARHKAAQPVVTSLSAPFPECHVSLPPKCSRLFPLATIVAIAALASALYARLGGWPRSNLTKLSKPNTALPNGWFRAGSQPAAYEMGTDRGVLRSGNASGYLKATAVLDGEFGTMMQKINGDAFRGKRVRFSGFLMAQGLQRRPYNGAWLWIRADSDQGPPLVGDTMHDRLIGNSRHWQECTLVIDAPENTGQIAVGVALLGKGQVWADDLRLEVVGKDVPLTAQPFFAQRRRGTIAKPESATKRFANLPAQPLNLDFDH